MMVRIEAPNANGLARHLLYGLIWMLLASSIAAESPDFTSAGRADAVVGLGTPESCTETDFDTALDAVQTGGGGTITFNCGGAHFIYFDSARLIASQVVIDGGGLITLSGRNLNRLFNVASGFGAVFELRNITLSNGFAPTGDGGAITNGSSDFATGGTLHLVNTVFENNRTSEEGGSGGAIISYGPVTAVNSRFENNRAANGGAVYLRFAGAIGTFTSTTFKNNRTLSATNGWGGAILLWDGAQLTVRGCDFDNNSARRGGAIHNQFANVGLVIEQGTLVRSNTATLEGGGLWLRAGTTEIHRSFILGNEAVSEGGGIYSREATLSITDSTIAQNSGFFGGGIRIRDGFTTLERVTLDGNSAGEGGAIILFGNANTQLSLLNSTLSGNTTSGPGGAIRISGNPPATIAIELRHVTIANNVSNTFPNSVGGLYIPFVNIPTFSLTLVNTALSGNSSPTCQIPSTIAAVSTARYSLWSDTSCSFGTSVQNHPNTPAALGPLAKNGGRTLTHAPITGSPLIDNGICLPGIATDQRAAHRLHGAACDIGSVEAGAAFPDSIFGDRFQDIP